MQEATVYSERLGAIGDEQFHAVADRLQIGRFVKAAPTTSGLFGQNVFVTTTEGEFVLRGVDTDVARATPDAVDQILAAMRWLGLA